MLFTTFIKLLLNLLKILKYNLDTVIIQIQSYKYEDVAIKDLGKMLTLFYRKTFCENYNILKMFTPFEDEFIVGSYFKKLKKRWITIFFNDT